MQLKSLVVPAVCAVLFLPLADVTAQGLLTIPQMPSAGTPTTSGVRKLTDSELSCSAMETEVAALEQEATAKREQSDALNAEFRKSQEELVSAMRSAVPTTAGMGLISMLPGGSVAGSLLAQSASSNRLNATAEYNRKMQAMQARAALMQTDIARAEARKDHLVGMYLQKGCRSTKSAGAEPRAE
ncbi:hypothetical protein [Ramlibacter humi]|uniref:Uncharacterized protein n=1 Tax=Ramlibacter humi TaxID=2530451 RepID=A0A4Z0BCW6_9BURK|nr:hypothetical protein [Ramlibacter humi]TFY96590.1 hypothetical protein EZ216_20265 [Ramlibacter humi]